MEISKSIIHLIEKEQSGNPSLQLSSNLLGIGEYEKLLIEKLNDAFRKDEKVLKTEFKIEEPKSFQNGVRSFSMDNSDSLFLSFSGNSLLRMIDLLTGNNLATGGYFVYAEYLYRNIKYLAVFIVRDEEGIIFKKDKEGDFEVETTVVVNTDKLAMAVRIDLEKLRLEEPRHLHFTKKQAHLSQYFFDWIEADLAAKSNDDTNKLIELINRLELDDFPINPVNNERYTPDEFRKQIYHNILSSGRIVRIRELSKTFWDDDNYLSNKFEEFNIEISNEFQAPESILKKLMKYEISSGKLRLIFTQNDIDSGRISKGEGFQIIINSEELLEKFNSI